MRASAPAPDATLNLLRADGPRQGLVTVRRGKRAEVVVSCGQVPDSLVTLTVCICTHDRPDYMRSCLAALVAQSMPPEAFEVLVVDSASSELAAAQLRVAVAGVANARLIRVDRPGASAARNAALREATTSHVAFLDDDALAAPDWVAQMFAALQETVPRPALIGGRVLPRWEAPLPAWWPEQLRGVLSIIEWEGRGEYRTPEVPRALEPWSVNMVVHRASALAVGAFEERLGRVGTSLLSDEDVQLAWKLQDAGFSVRYDSRLLVHHQIQAPRLRPEWLLERLYWQGASTVVTRRLLAQPELVWRELARRLVVEMLSAPAAMLPGNSTRLLPLRWRYAYACGFTRMALAGMGRKRHVLARALARVMGRGALPGKPRVRA